MKYNELTRRYFETARCAGVLEGPDVRSAASAGSRAQGTWVQFDVQIDAARGAVAIRAVRLSRLRLPARHRRLRLAGGAGGGPARESGRLPESVQLAAASALTCRWRSSAGC